MAFVSGNCVATGKPATVARPGGCGRTTSNTEMPLDQPESSYSGSRYQSRPKSSPFGLYFHGVLLKLKSATCTANDAVMLADPFPCRSETAFPSIESE